MATAQGRSHARALERVERLCAAYSQERALRTTLLGEIRREVEFDWYAWLLTDPATEVGCSPLAEIPSLGDLPRLIRAKYLTTLNRWTTLEAPVATLQAGSGGALAKSHVWSEVLSGYGVVDVASLVFRDSFGCWGWLDLWRRAESGPFDGRECEYLAEVVDPITAGLRRAVGRCFETGSAQPIEGGGPVVLFVSPQLEVKAQTPDTERLLSILIPPVGNRRAIPAAAYNVAAQALAVEEGVDTHPALARVHLQGGVWLTVRAARVDSSAHLPERDIAVAIEVASASSRRDLFTRSHGLSPREVEVVDQVAHGADTRTIAATLFVSQHTVQDHLKSIFAKTGVRNRRTLLARLTGH